MNSRKLVLAALGAALYVVATLTLAPISYGLIQVRVGEALCMLPLFCLEAVPALTLGCLLANLLGPSMGLLDILLGTFCTFLGALGTYLLRKKTPALALAPNVLCNALGVGVVLQVSTGIPYALCAMSVAAGQIVAVYALGLPLALWLRKNRILNKLLNS